MEVVYGYKETVGHFSALLNSVSKSASCPGSLYHAEVCFLYQFTLGVLAQHSYIYMPNITMSCP